MKKSTKAAAATANQAAIKTNYMTITNVSADGSMRRAGIITFNGKSIYVLDLGDTQNSTLFEKGIKIIDSLVTPKRKEYLFNIFKVLLPNADITNKELWEKSQKICYLIAFVCDIALHSNRELAYPAAYDKDFNRYVANLFDHYHLDDAFNNYIKLEGKLIPIPEIFINPEKYFYNIA